MYYKQAVQHTFYLIIIRKKAVSTARQGVAAQGSDLFPTLPHTGSHTSCPLGAHLVLGVLGLRLACGAEVLGSSRSPIRQLQIRLLIGRGRAQMQCSTHFPRFIIDHESIKEGNYQYHTVHHVQ